MADLVITATSVVAGSGASTTNGAAGETITAGQAVYKAASGLWLKADNNAGTEIARQAQGIALNGAAINQPVRVLTGGLLTLGATMTAGVAYYLSDTPGGICPVADVGAAEYVVQIGIATTTAIIDVDIKYPGVAL